MCQTGQEKKLSCVILDVFNLTTLSQEEQNNTFNNISVTVVANVKDGSDMKSLFHGLMTFSVYFALHPRLDEEKLSPELSHPFCITAKKLVVVVLLHLFVVILWIFTLSLHHSAVNFTAVCDHFTAVFGRLLLVVVILLFLVVVFGLPAVIVVTVQLFVVLLHLYVVASRCFVTVQLFFGHLW